MAPILDIQLARPENTQGQQSELVVVGGWDHQTHMNLVKQGVGLKSIKSFEGIIPNNFVQEFYTFDNMLFLRIYGYDQLLGMKADLKGKKNLSVDGFEVSRNLTVKATEQIIGFSIIKLTQPESEYFSCKSEQQ